MVVELPLMIQRRWELPLQVSVIAVNRIRQLRLIGRYQTGKLLSTGYTYQVQAQ
jgi:hypothetical protein